MKKETLKLRILASLCLVFIIINMFFIKKYLLSNLAFTIFIFLTILIRYVENGRVFKNNLEDKIDIIFIILSLIYIIIEILKK